MIITLHIVSRKEHDLLSISCSPCDFQKFVTKIRNIISLFLRKLASTVRVIISNNRVIQRINCFANCSFFLDNGVLKTFFERKKKRTVLEPMRVNRIGRNAIVCRENWLFKTRSTAEGNLHDCLSRTFVWWRATSDEWTVVEKFYRFEFISFPIGKTFRRRNNCHAKNIPISIVASCCCCF